MSGVLNNTGLVFGQMNEPPGARARVALTGLTQAEYFRDKEGQDVLLFVDNIFRFTQAGSEVSALLEEYLLLLDINQLLQLILVLYKKELHQQLRVLLLLCKLFMCLLMT